MADSYLFSSVHVDHRGKMAVYVTRTGQWSPKYATYPEFSAQAGVPKIWSPMQDVLIINKKIKVHADCCGSHELGSAR